MKQLFSAVLLLVAFAVVPTWSHAAESFDPEKPFNQAIAKNLLRSFLNQALDVLDEHFEMSGSFNPDGKQRDQRQHLKFRFYPEGKSKSRESITAEGWVDQPPDSSQQDFYFRFSLPKAPQKSTQPQFGHVL